MPRREYEKVAPAEADDHFDASDSAADSDIEHHDGVQVRHLRTSDETRRHDGETLAAEEEAEQLLVGGKSSRVGRLFGQKEGSREARKGRDHAKRKRRGGEKGGESELMYAMEEGPRNSDESSGNSSEVDFHNLKETQAKHKVGSLI